MQDVNSLLPRQRDARDLVTVQFIAQHLEMFIRRVESRRQERQFNDLVITNDRVGSKSRCKPTTKANGLIFAGTLEAVFDLKTTSFTISCLIDFLGVNVLNEA